MTSPQGNPARQEPLLWLQLLGLAALPLEVAALLVVLAGADPGPLPGFERVFCWAIGALGPAVLFWKLPPDLWSMLLLQVPLRGRTAHQLQLSALQSALPLKLLGAAGAPLLLPLLWWTDRAAGLAWSVSPFTTTPRALVLLLASALLALMLWQWQQILQALWMFSRPAPQFAQTLPLTTTDAADRRLNIGLPLLLLTPLATSEATPAPTMSQPSTIPATTSTPQPVSGLADSEQSDQAFQVPASEARDQSPEIEPSTQGLADSAEQLSVEPALEPVAVQATAEPASEPEQPPLPSSEDESEPQPEGDPCPEGQLNPEPDSALPGPIAEISTAVEPEQAAEQTEGSNLDQQI